LGLGFALPDGEIAMFHSVLYNAATVEGHLFIGELTGKKGFMIKPMPTPFIASNFHYVQTSSYKTIPYSELVR
jgi:hypothetical protein